jgi:hypothetical protein
MKRVITLAAALCALAAGAASTASAQATITTTCPSGSTQVASVTYAQAGDPVYGAAGNVWAIATYTRTMLVFRIPRASNTYCATWRDTGTFVTVAGKSPGGTGYVPAGIAGTLTRTAVTSNFTATYRPAAATSGSAGTHVGPFDWTSLYFTNVEGLDRVWYADLYTAGAAGSWGSRTGYASYCDVT